MPQQDANLPVTSSTEPACAAEAFACYQDAIQTLRRADIPFAVCGGLAFHSHTGIWRTTKDLDLVLVPEAVPPALELLRDEGFNTCIEDPIWLAKARRGEYFVDLIAGVGNATLAVEPSWIERAIEDEILGIPCKVLGVEEMIASKLFVTRRERFDGADIAHMVQSCGGELDWERLLKSVGPYWEMLYWSLVLFAFIYPAHVKLVPESLWLDLTWRFAEHVIKSTSGEPFRGSLVDPKMFAIDVNEWGERDLYRELSASYPHLLPGNDWFRSAE